MNKKIGFIGLGKLGLPSAEAMAKKGYTVFGFDIQTKTSSHIEILSSVEDVVKNADLIFVATPTPHEPGYDGRYPTSHKIPKDFNYASVKDVLKTINKVITQKQILVLISTVLPGTIRKQLEPLVFNSKIIYNPYLIAMGTVEYDVYNPEMIMIGSDRSKKSTADVNTLINFYKDLCSQSPRIETGTWEEVEAIKIFYNTFISTKISFVNMIQDVACKIDNMNVDKVIGALTNSSKRILSSAYMKPGMGDGGACHPRDNIALRWLAQDLKLGYDFFENIMTAREKQAENMALEILKYGKNIKFSSDSYKPNTDLVDGSYSLLVQHYIQKHGGIVCKDYDSAVEVIVRVHESDTIPDNKETIIFDPWRSYPEANNVVSYGK